MILSRRCWPFPTPNCVPKSARSTSKCGAPCACWWKAVASCAGVLAIVASLAACRPAEPTAAEPIAPLLEVALEPTQEAIATASSSAVVAVREAVEAVVPPAPLPPPQIDSGAHMATCARELIVRWEVTSPAYYTRRLQGVIWPGGASGATWGIGYDGGHQTHGVIRRDWHAHASVDRLATTAGITGTRARDLLPGLRGIVTPYLYAADVFEAASLPLYHGRARAAFGRNAFDALPVGPQCALVSLVYNRGGGMAGESRREMRTLRDTCIPAGDVDCIASELRSMCRIWRGTPNGPGLCARRDHEAEVTLSRIPA